MVCISLPRRSLTRLKVTASCAALVLLACGEDGARPAEAEQPAARVWVGALEETDAKIGVVHADAEAVFFLCGGETTYPELTRWFSGATALDSAFFFEAAEFRVDGEPAGDALAGTVLRASEGGNAWRADPADPGTLAGLYSGQAPCGRVGLIVSQASVDEEPTGQGACVRFVDGEISVEQVNPVLPLVRIEDFIRVTVASDPDREVTVRPLLPAAF